MRCQIEPEAEFAAAMAEVAARFADSPEHASEPAPAVVLLVQTRKDLNRLLPEIEKLLR